MQVICVEEDRELDLKELFSFFKNHIKEAFEQTNLEK